MPNSSLISVIIPAYNHEDYVQGTIQSIIDQSYQNIELIIIDDGSKDSTWQKILEMKERAETRFSRVVFETKENAGVCDTLNRMLEKTQGEYVFFTASDDLVKSHAIEKEVSFLKNNLNYVFVVGDCELIDNDNRRIYWDKDRNVVYDEKEAKYLTFASFLKTHRKEVDFQSDSFGSYLSLLKGNYIPNGFMMRRSACDNFLPITSETPLEDLWMLLQVSKCGKFKYINEVLACYRWHDSNSIKNTEKIEKYTCQTLMHEYNLAQKEGKSEYLPLILEALEARVISKKSKGKKGLFQIIDIEKFRSKEKIIKLLGVVIYKNNKLH